MGLQGFLGLFLICMHYSLSDISKRLSAGDGISPLWKRKIWKKNTGKQLQFEISIFFCFHSIPLFFLSIPLMHLSTYVSCFFLLFHLFIFLVFLLIYCSKIQSRQADCHTHVQNVQCTCNQIFMFHPSCFANLQPFRKQVKLLRRWRRWISEIWWSIWEQLLR